MTTDKVGLFGDPIRTSIEVNKLELLWGVVTAARNLRTDDPELINAISALESYFQGEGDDDDLAI